MSDDDDQAHAKIARTTAVTDQIPLCHVAEGGDRAPAVVAAVCRAHPHVHYRDNKVNEDHGSTCRAEARIDGRVQAAQLGRRSTNTGGGRFGT